MTPTKFDQIVENLANERVQQKLAGFEKQVAAAFESIGIAPNYYNRWSGGERGSQALMVMRHLLGREATTEKPCGYPQKLWDDAKQQVSKELLQTMDVMAQALAAKPTKGNPPIAKETK